MLARREGAGLRFAVADDRSHNEIRVVEGRAEGVAERVAEFAALVNGSRRFRRDVTGNAAREGELFEEFLHPFLVLGDVRVNLAVGAFEPGVATMPGPP